MCKKKIFILACFLLSNIELLYSKEILLNKNNSLILRGTVTNTNINNLIEDTINKCNKLNDSNDSTMTALMTDQVYEIKGNDSNDSKNGDCSYIASLFSETKSCGVSDYLSSVIDSIMNSKPINFIKKLTMTGQRPELYLVIDSPGGSVFAGVDYIRVMEASDCDIHTVTIEGASMGFQIAQKGVRRYLARYGTLMSHRASLGGISGQLDGELESRINYIKSVIESLDIFVAARIGISLEEYKSRIVNEWWSFDKQAIRENLADEIVDIKCDNDLLKGEYTEEFRTMFGSVDVTWSMCPILRAPKKVELRR